MKNLTLMFALLLMHCISHAQAAAFVDPAQAFNKMQLEKKEGSSYERIGPYKVKGTPYLYGGGQVASVFAKGFSIKDVIKVNYNTYNQQLELVFNKETAAEIKNNAEVDSFLIKVSMTDYKADLKFFSVKLFSSKDNFFLQEVYKGTKYSLFKRYKSDLGYVSTNYVQSDLREYDLIFDYYYSYTFCDWYSLLFSRYFIQPSPPPFLKPASLLAFAVSG